MRKQIIGLRKLTNNIKVLSGLRKKACVRYFLSNFYFSPNDSPSKTIKNAFYFIEKALFILEILTYTYSVFPSFLPVSHCFRA